MSVNRINVDVLVLGSGPGGYSAAFRASDLGFNVALVEKHKVLGGVCLNVGCIPSKALLYAAKVIDEVKYFEDKGIKFSGCVIDPSKIVAWKKQIIANLNNGLNGLANKRKIKIIHGEGEFIDANTLKVNELTIGFNYAVIAVGSRATTLPYVHDPRIFDSTQGLTLNNIGSRLLIIGGGVIGLEMATIYSALGSKVTIVEAGQSLLMGMDLDLAKIIEHRFREKHLDIYLHSLVTEVNNLPDVLEVFIKNRNNEEIQKYLFDNILVAIGRTPNGDRCGGEKIGLDIDSKGYINVNKKMQTNIPHIYAVGDAVGNPMLAHKSSMEGKIAAENIKGLNHYFEALCIPQVVYTNPEVACCGMSELDAKKQNIEYNTVIFPWAASGKAMIYNYKDGMTKVIFNKNTKRVIGGSIIGANAGDLISEISLAIEMGCDAQDLALTIHPHPTFSETIAMSAEIFEGTVTDLYQLK